MGSGDASACVTYTPQAQAALSCCEYDRDRCWPSAPIPALVHVIGATEAGQHEPKPDGHWNGHDRHDQGDRNAERLLTAQAAVDELEHEHRDEDRQGVAPVPAPGACETRDGSRAATPSPAVLPCRRAWMFSGGSVGTEQSDERSFRSRRVVVPATLG